MKTSIIVPEELHHRLKVQAALEQTDVSRLLCTLAEEYLKKMEGVNKLMRASPIYRQVRQRMLAKKGAK